MSLSVLLLVLAFIAFVLAAFNVQLGSINLIGAGLALWVLSLLIGGVAGLSTTMLLVIVVVVVLVVVLATVLRRNPPAAK
jgi:hypothetical protein